MTVTNNVAEFDHVLLCCGYVFSSGREPNSDVKVVRVSHNEKRDSKEKRDSIQQGGLKNDNRMGTKNH